MALVMCLECYPYLHITYKYKSNAFKKNKSCIFLYIQYKIIITPSKIGFTIFFSEGGFIINYLKNNLFVD